MRSYMYAYIESVRDIWPSGQIGIDVGCAPRNAPLLSSQKGSLTIEYLELAVVLTEE